MRILIYTPVFWPSIGGTEEMARMLATEWARAGHDVTVYTPAVRVVAGGELPLFRTVRGGGAGGFARLLSKTDVVVHNPVSLRALPFYWGWSGVLFFIHHTWLSRADGRVGWQDYLKRLALRCGHSIAVSKAIAAAIPVTAEVITNCYDQARFDGPFQPWAERPPGSLVFVGRLVSDKGADLAIAAVARLRAEGHDVSLAIAGQGPDEASLRAQVVDLGLSGYVNFLGSVRGAALRDLLQTRRVLMVPSRWREPFGLVALEGLACGCRVVASDGGGLVEAVGEFGQIFLRGNLDELVKSTVHALCSPGHSVSAVQSHLAGFTTTEVAARYLRCFERAVSAKKGQVL